MNDSESTSVGRPRKGSLIWRKDGWHGRFWAMVDGESMRVIRPLGTQLKPVAVRKLAKLVAEGAPTASAIQVETFAEAGARVYELRRLDIVSATDEFRRLKMHAFPTLGVLAVSKIAPGDINAALDECKRARLSRQTVVHVRQAIRNVFEQLKREGALSVSPADEARMPKFSSEVRKERTVLTDDELARYLGWVHPDERFVLCALERQTMACVARMFGGLRTGDLHALAWEAFDVDGGAFSWGWAPRQKTKRPQLLAVPEMLRPLLRDWWERHGRPAVGPVFPLRSGDHAGAKRQGGSHAHSFRRDLRRAFGIDTPVPLVKVRKNGRPLTRYEWSEARALTPREHEIFEESAYTLPVDFHSWRRAFSQALADADVNIQQATALAGHASLAAHGRYLASSGRMRTLPEAALPKIRISLTSTGEFRHGPCLNPVAGDGGELRNQYDLRVGVSGFEPPTTGTQSTGTGPLSLVLGGFVGDSSVPKGRRSVPNAPPCLNSVPKLGEPSPLLDAALADAMLSMALKGMAARIALSFGGGSLAGQGRGQA